MIHPVFFVPLFKDGTEREREFSLFALKTMLEALVKVNVGWIASHRSEWRPIYDLKKLGVRYQPERGTEDWLSIPAIYDAAKINKPIDCEDWAAARAAELRLGLGSRRLGKVRAIADIRGRVMPDGQVRMHAFVRYPDGTVEDPSVIMGMPGGGAVEWERKYPVAVMRQVERAKRLARSAA
jgi:hypothetical protein